MNVVFIIARTIFAIAFFGAGLILICAAIDMIGGLGWGYSFKDVWPGLGILVITAVGWLLVGLIEKIVLDVLARR